MAAVGLPGACAACRSSGAVSVMWRVWVARACVIVPLILLAVVLIWHLGHVVQQLPATAGAVTGGSLYLRRKGRR